MTMSSLTDVYLPVYGKCTSPRQDSVRKVTVHHMGGNLTVEECQSVFNVPSREASSNYGIGSDGRIACYIDEDDRAWTSASWWNDNQAITIEVADEDCYNWVPSDAAYRSTVRLCADICTRYGIEPSYTGGTGGTFTEHRMFAATACPGSWWHSHMDSFVQDVRDEMEDDMQPHDVWEYNWAETAPYGNMYNCAVNTNETVNHMPASVWEYNWGDTAPQGNMYNCVTAMYIMVEEMAEKIEQLSEKVDSISIGGVDAKAIAKAVNDDAAKRMIS